MTQSATKISLRKDVQYSITDGPSKMGFLNSYGDGAEIKFTVSDGSNSRQFSLVINDIARESGRSGFVYSASVTTGDLLWVKGTHVIETVPVWGVYNVTDGRRRTGFLKIGKIRINIVPID